jgi:vancomycin permeability regulator SanA
MRSRSIAKSIQMSLLRLYHELIRRIWLVGSGVAFAVLLVLVGPTYAMHVLNAHNNSSGDVAIVLGGAVNDGKPSAGLNDNLHTAAALYKSGKAKVVLLSGSNNGSSQNEPAVMQQVVEHDGVPSNAVVLDYSGYGAYDECYRASKLFAIKDASISSSSQYTSQAIVTCRVLGSNSVGVDTSQQFRNYPAMHPTEGMVSIDQSVVQNY